MQLSVFLNGTILPKYFMIYIIMLKGLLGLEVGLPALKAAPR